MKNHHPDRPGKDPVKHLRRKLMLCQGALAVAVVIIVLLAAHYHVLPLVTKLKESAVLKANTDIPHYDQVMKIIGPLSYSGYQALQRPEVELSIDFKNKSWTLSNVHRFDSQGQVILEDDRYGLCGELSDYTYRKIKPLFEHDYAIHFMKAAESGFFLHPRSSHYILHLTEKANPGNTLIIDPSFGRYGPSDEFDNYILGEFMGRANFTPDISLPINIAMPIMIKKGFMIELSVDDVEGRFDQNNFCISLSAIQQYRFSGRYVLAFRFWNGEMQFFENKQLADWLIDRDQYQALKRQINAWFKKIVGKEHPQINLGLLADFGRETNP